MPTCRYCCQEIDSHARRCPHCQSDVTVFGKFRSLQPIVSVLIAVGGFVYGLVERGNAKTSQGEMQAEQAALADVLQTVPPQDLASKYGNDSRSEEELKTELRRNPRNLDARIRLRMKQHVHRKGASGRSKSTTVSSGNRRPDRR